MPSYMFGLPAIALAIYNTARPENRKKIKGLLASGLVACVIGGITEPLEFYIPFLITSFICFPLYHGWTWIYDDGNIKGGNWKY